MSVEEGLVLPISQAQLTGIPVMVKKADGQSATCSARYMGAAHT